MRRVSGQAQCQLAARVCIAQLCEVWFETSAFKMVQILMEVAATLEEIGCATVMPLGSAIGTGQGIFTLEEIRIIISEAKVPVIVDAGLGVPSDAAQALEEGSDAVLVNTAIAQAEDPTAMADAFRLGVQAGRVAYLAGRIGRKTSGVASSPTEGMVTSSNSPK